MGKDLYYGLPTGLADPSNEPRAITPSDSTPFPGGQCNYIYVGMAGDMRASYKDNKDGPVTHKNLAVGWHPLRPTQIYATGTTAADIVIHY